MTDAAPEPAPDGQPTAEHAALDTEHAELVAPTGPLSPAASSPPADERPELAVGAAFAGGLVLALFLKRLAR
ncbi:MAG TPA: hypothetical protein VFG31_00795 [Conexibacter sp.]|nr:hypothetical protein [Conexibacter sp.]